MTDPIQPVRRALSPARRLALGAAFAATFVAGGLILSGPSAVALQMAAEHMGGGHGDVHLRGMAHVKHMLEIADASPDQSAKIDAILAAALQSTTPMQDRIGSTHRELHRLLTAPVVDHAALEQLRAARLADVDALSRTMVTAIADAADVLTPEQRLKLSQSMGGRHGAAPKS